MSADADGADAVFDRAALDTLADEVAGRIAVRFATQYLELLPDRVTRIKQALADEDLAAALDTALSLKVTSVTVGAVELSTSAAEIEDFVRSEDVRSASLRAQELDQKAAAFTVAVASYIESAGSPD